MKNTKKRGVTLIDAMVACALFMIVFVGIASALELSINVIQNNKARAGAIALADERMEYIRSLTYAQMGTVGGIPAGVVPQYDTPSLNGISYTRRTFIEYEDDPYDGLGSLDTFGGTADYKALKVDVSWNSTTGVHDMVLVGRAEPTIGYESIVPGGVLTINVQNAVSSPILNAQVQIVNATTTPTSAAINVTTYTNASGTVSFIGATSTGAYQISVTKTGYSTDGTYNIPNSTRGLLTVTANQNNTYNFSIDVLGTKTINTFLAIATSTGSDSFSNMSNIATSTNITVTGGVAKLSGSAPYPSYGELQSIAITPSIPSAWRTFTASSTVPSGTSITYRFYDGAGQNLIPDSQLPGNAAGFTTSSIGLVNVSTTTYPSIRVDAILSGSSSATPSVDSYSLVYAYGPTPLGNIPFTLAGAKTIANGSSPTYKYNQGLSTNSSGTLVLANMEWDTYTMTVSGASGYDIASACHPVSEYVSNQSTTTKFAFAPGTQTTSNMYLWPHTSNSLLVEVRAASGNALIPYATVGLAKSGYAATTTADSCGQAFFPGLSAATYTYTLVHAGNATTSATAPVSGQSRIVPTMN